MAYDRFLIAPFDDKSGFRTNVKPWLVPDQAFEVLNNAYVFRGRVRKRFGTTWLGATQLQTRLRIGLVNTFALAGGAAVGITDAGGNATGIVPAAFGSIGQYFTIGTQEFLIVSIAAGAQPMSQSVTPPIATATFNAATGVYVFSGALPLTQILFTDNTAKTTNGSGTVHGYAPGNTFAKGQMFSIGSQVFTVSATGTPANMLISGSAATAQFNTTTGEFTITGLGADTGTQVYFYPALPVMGLLSQESPATNVEPIIAFDTRYAYEYLATGWDRIAGEAEAGAATWSGSDSQFFWNTNWVGNGPNTNVFFVTNFNNSEPQNMRYLVYGTTIWNQYAPAITGSTNLTSALMLVPFKNRLVALNTWESGSNYRARARYSQIGSPLDVAAFRQDTPGKGNFIDAATIEAIISSEFVKDRLIVFFERSTWELVYTGNEVAPFTWQQINTELGAESTFSIIPFDKVCIGIGNVGIEACNGINVDRIDTSIPTQVFEIHNDDDGIFRVYGIRDYFAEQLYWTIPSTSRNTMTPYPDQVLVYNYATGTWAINDDSITAFGYFQPTTGTLWSSQTVKWDQSTPWASGAYQSNFRQVIGGNQEGYTFICDTGAPTQSPNLQITDLTVASNIITITAINHNLLASDDGDYIYLQDIVGTGNLNLINNKIYLITSTTQNTFTISYNDTSVVLAGTYRGNGTIARVPMINIKTKEYNFYGDKGRNMYVQKVDFMVDRTGNKDLSGNLVGAGSIQINSYVSTSVESILPLIGNNILTTAAYPNTYEETAFPTRVIHSMYLWADGEFIQLQLTMSDAQMIDINIRQADFQLHSMLFYVTATTSRPQ